MSGNELLSMALRLQRTHYAPLKCHSATAVRVGALQSRASDEASPHLSHLTPHRHRASPQSPHTESDTRHTG